MTAEVAVLNKTAIALAADSAVTGREKIYNSVNKLFRLSDHRPVGVMIHGQAEFMGIPWESVIKMHRSALGTQSYPTLSEYVTSFVKFVREQHGRVPKEQREMYVRSVCADHLETVKQHIRSELGKHPNDPPEQVMRRSVEEDCLGQLCANFHEIQGLPNNARDEFNNQFGGIINAQIQSVFHDLPIPNAIAELVSRHCAEALLRQHFVFSSGIVIAGFGEDEIFPSLAELNFEGLALGDHVKYRMVRRAGVDFGISARIVAFAQGEMVQTFLTGAHPAYLTHVNSYLCDALKRYNNQILKSLPDLPPLQRADLRAKMEAGTDEMIKQFDSGITDFAQRTHIDPILNAVEMLPKDELAAMAESLVNLTVLKRRVSTDPETVGGPIDVAVISKGDGFIWIKRKHYFTKDLNPRYITQYFPIGQFEQGQ